MKTHYATRIYTPISRRRIAVYALRTSLIAVSLLCSCNKTETNGKGVLKGTISIGPLCPVETIPPKPECMPTQETYKAWAIAVYQLNRGEKYNVLDPDLNGNYQIELPTGSYIIDYDNLNTIRLGRSNLPVTVTIVTADTAQLDINIDTGIR